MLKNWRASGRWKTLVGNWNSVRQSLSNKGEIKYTLSKAICSGVFSKMLEKNYNRIDIDSQVAHFWSLVAQLDDAFGACLLHVQIYRIDQSSSFSLVHCELTNVVREQIFKHYHC